VREKSILAMRQAILAQGLGSFYRRLLHLPHFRRLGAWLSGRGHA
jgi:hypothetical protein